MAAPVPGSVYLAMIHLDITRVTARAIECAYLDGLVSRLTALQVTFFVLYEAVNCHITWNGQTIPFSQIRKLCDCGVQLKFAVLLNIANWKEITKQHHR